jgi:multidrug efflux pump subunit AcrA (membrane-fusion protein)
LVPGVAAISAVILLKPNPKFNKIPPEKPTAPIVSVIYANPITQNITVKSQGTVEPRREIDLVSEVAGKISHVDKQFVNGGVFEQHQILIKFDDQDYQIELVRAKAALANAENVLAQENGLARQAK